MSNTVRVPHILLPIRGTDMSKYSVIACDQYTSNLTYWNSLSKYVGNSVSTLHMIYPEAYLEHTDNDSYIKQINKNIASYLAEGKLEDIGECFVLVERTTSYGVRRLGLILAVDLEDYSFEKGSKTPIKASEATIVERIPPRLKIRKDAPIELPHILVLFDDKEKSIVEPLYENRESLECLYDFELNKDGGHIRGYKVNPQDLLSKFNLLSSKNKKNNGLLFIVGDGNHSLATAKAHWDLIKEGLTSKEREDYPARFALVEANNLYDEGIIFEPIHRVLFNGGNEFVEALTKVCKGDFVSYTYINKEKRELRLPSNAPEAYKLVQTFIDKYLSTHLDIKIDFIHDEDELIKTADGNENAVAIKMPALTKDDLFSFISKDQVLPRKSFSMGHANEKRYYLEAKKIIK